MPWLLSSVRPLVTGGANKGMAGNEVTTLFESSFNKANVTGIRESLIQKLPLLASIAGLMDTHGGPAIVIMNQYANYGKGHTIHFASCNFMHLTPSSMR